MAAAAEESAKSRRWNAAARIAAAAEAASASARKARWELPVTKARPDRRGKRDIQDRRVFRERKEPRVIPDRLDLADPKETGAKWAFPDSPASTEFTVFKDLPGPEVHVVWTAAMELRVNPVVRVFPERRVPKVLQVPRALRERRAYPAASA